MFVSAWACSPLPRKPGVCSPAQAPSNTRLESMVFAWSEVKSFETELITKLQTRGLAMKNHGVCYPWFSLLLFFCYNTIPAFMHTTMSTSPPALLFVKPGVRLNNTSKKLFNHFHAVASRGCITTEQAERENLCDLLLVLQVLLVLWNICYFASGIKLLLVSCALIFGGVGLAGVFWAVVSLFNVNMRLYHLFWAAKI
ncbi:uncharacterized protein LOC120712254 isoform X2 [Panicum virgatum]|uniref:uncharacterized protein LOC120712254 isoform X2 n=1 Tax=Panicum virgatum TaxID=38727 RepID=UPI0019D60309|nr:uncharacterized protein LOC120712254 isoform X2 [Panicum virgatum]